MQVILLDKKVHLKGFAKGFESLNLVRILVYISLVISSYMDIWGEKGLVKAHLLSFFIFIKGFFEGFDFGNLFRICL